MIMNIHAILFFHYQRIVLANNASSIDRTDKNPLENPNLFDGDILIDKSSGESRAVVLGENDLWEDAIVYYKFTPTLSYSNKKLLLSIFRYVEKETCVIFKERKNEEDFVYITQGKGCNSYVGRKGGIQIMTLGRRCWYRGTILHELGHVLGYFHEHNRPDRDDYIEIMWKNIREDSITNFEKYRYDKVNLLAPYSYETIMHYGEKAFSKNDQITMKAKKSNVLLEEVYKRNVFAESDIKWIKKLYRCEQFDNSDLPDIRK